MLFRNGKFYRVDMRSREGILLRDTSNALLDQLGRNPSAAEKILIQRLAWLHLCITSLDQRVLSGTVDYDEATAYASHINSFSLGLTNLGLLGNALKLPTLSTDHPTTESLKTRAARAEVRESVRVDECAQNSSHVCTTLRIVLALPSAEDLAETGDCCASDTITSEDSPRATEHRRNAPCPHRDTTPRNISMQSRQNTVALD
jgi:hypothetical protein